MASPGSRVVCRLAQWAAIAVASSGAVQASPCARGGSVAPIPWIVTQETRLSLQDPPTSFQAGFGSQNVLDTDVLLVSAPSEDVGSAKNAGMVHVYSRVGGVWTSSAPLIAGDLQAQQSFGSAIAKYGPTIAVGAKSEDRAGGANAGAAYVFEFDGATWNQQTKLVAPDGSSDDFFGSSVAIDADTLVLGAPLNAPAQTGPSGAIYVFRKASGTWGQEAKITAFTTRLAQSLAIDGDTMVAGAPYDTHFGLKTNAGAAFVFVRSGSTWTEQARLEASDPHHSEEFGYSVSISGDVIAVGAHNDDTSRGAVYMFERRGSSWIQTQKLVGFDEGAFDNFGESVRVSASILIVGARSDDPFGFNAAGAAYLFQRSGSTWNPSIKVVAGDYAPGAGFGLWTSIEANRVAISDLTSAYVFRFEEAPAFCFGDGSSGTVCPCNPPNVVPAPSGGSASGCANSFNPAGAHLEIAGTLTPDTLSIRADIGPSYGGFCFLVKGDAASATGFANGDGIRCVDGALVRAGGHNAGTNGDPVGQWRYPNATQTLSISVATGQQPSQSAFYQVIYRNAAADFCSPGTTNWTNAVQVDW